MKLFYLPGACSRAPHIVLNELEMPVELIKIDPANKSAEFLKANPKGQVPTLVLDNGESITEVAVILQYLADLKPERQLLPKFGTFERYRALELLNFTATEIHKGFGPLWAGDRLVRHPEGAAQLREAVIHTLGTKFDFLEKTLEGRTFALGDPFSVCDAYLFTVLGWARYHSVDMSRWTRILGYMERVQGRPSVVKTLQIESGKPA